MTFGSWTTNYMGLSTSMIAVKRNDGFEGKPAAAIEMSLEASSNSGIMGDTILYLCDTTNFLDEIMLLAPLVH